MAGVRGAQLSERIQQIVAALLERRVKDPRLGFVTITDVRVTGDNQHASVFYTVMGDEAARADTAQALASATGMLRSEVGRQLAVRHTPSLEFVLDAVPDTAREIEESLARARAADEQVARRAVGAQYAGDPDPYRTRDDESGETEES